MFNKLTNFLDKHIDFSWKKSYKTESKSKKIKIINNISNNGLLKCIVDIYDKELYKKNAVLRLISEVIVIDSRPVNSKKVLFKHNFVVNSWVEEIEIDIKKYKNYTYEWKKIYINLYLELVVDDSIFFDTKITSNIQNSLFIKPKVTNAWKSLIDPKDNFNILDNLKAIPFQAMFFVLGLSIVWGLVILVNTIVWFHDQFTADGLTYFYSHYNSDWESNSPLFNSLASSWALWAWIWFMIKTQLRKYMTFKFKQIKFLWERNKKYKLKDIVTWKSKIDLKDIELRVVACNMEKWQYTRWSWSNRRTVSFSEPIRALLVYNEKIDFIPKKTDICEYIKWEFSFEKMYKRLYPEQKISNSHWLFIHWEVQLIHKKLIDQELIWKSESFRYNYFLEW